MTTLNTVARRFAKNSATLALGSGSCLAAILMLSISMMAGGVAKADQSGNGSSSLQVKLADLDLSTANGQQIAQARMHEAARTACNRVADELDLSHHDNFLRCVDTATAKAGERLQALLTRQSTETLARADVK